MRKRLGAILQRLPINPPPPPNQNQGSSATGLAYDSILLLFHSTGAHRPVSDGHEVLREEGVTLQRVDRAAVPLVDDADA
eukprot:326095-Pleurochrysis_carterae.AAC.1